MCNDHIRVIGSVTLNIYHFFVLGTFRIFLLITYFTFLHNSKQNLLFISTKALYVMKLCCIYQNKAVAAALYLPAIILQIVYYFTK
jgi:hypothetical protein